MINDIIITTAGNVADRKIRKYLGIVSGTDIYLVGGLVGGGLATQESLYERALKNAISTMSKRAESLGADAVIGVSVSFTSPGGLNYMILALTGTAVLTDGESECEISNEDIPTL